MQQDSKIKKITFLIGNGFDLGLGMKTRYTDIYEGYIKSPSPSETIFDFKAELESHAMHNYENWSDFEMGMAAYAATLSSENELIECVRDFKGFMVNHLRSENDRVMKLIKADVYDSGWSHELERSLESFYSELTPNDIARIDKSIKGYQIQRNYITFNYTSTLGGFLGLNYRYRKIVESNPIHIHGTLDGDVVLGIDNIEQIKGAPYTLSHRGARAFVKTIFNKQFDEARVELAKNTILQSNIICIYGFSMGDSDKTWNDLLTSWLLQNPENHLIVYQYDESKYNYYNRDEIMDVEEEKKLLLLDKLNVDEVVLNQLHIPVGTDIFNFSPPEIKPTYKTAGSMKLTV